MVEIFGKVLWEQSFLCGHWA